MTQQRGTEAPHALGFADWEHPHGVCSGQCEPEGYLGRSLTHQQANWPPVVADDGTSVWGGVVRHDEIDRDGVQHLGQPVYLLNVGGHAVEVPLDAAAAIADSIASDVVRAAVTSPASGRVPAPRPRR